MSTSSQLRKQVEAALESRFPSALSLRPPAPPELLSCGVPEIDRALGGGLPLGAITELTGASSSGRTSLGLSILATATGGGESCAYVDACDAMDPVSAAATGVDLRRLLWVRGSEASVVGSRPTQRAQTAPISLATLNKPSGGRGGRHPREESRDLPQSISTLFQRAPQEPDFTPRCSESKPRPPLQPVAIAKVAAEARAFSSPRGARRETWSRLDQALRATDLLLNAGGFRAIVLDLGDASPEQARRVPLATWYRFRLQAEKSRVLFLLITRVACANSCAAASLNCVPAESDWDAAAANGPRLLNALRYRVQVERSRYAAHGKKPSASVTTAWTSRTVWAR